MSSSAKDLKNKGTAAFKSSKWNDAIKFYSQALELEDADFMTMANRSAAYLKLGDIEYAMQDADRCLESKPDYHMGYVRKASAYHSMKQYENAVATFQEALQQCSSENEEPLKAGLEAAKRARILHTTASLAARKTQATRKAAVSRQKKCQGAMNIAQFVQEETKSVKLESTSLQAQLDMFVELKKLQDEEKIDLLFYLLDKDHHGKINGSSLAAALREGNAHLSLSESLQQAMALIAKFDQGDDAHLSHDEFTAAAQTMSEHMKCTPSEFAEFLVFQLMFPERSVYTQQENEHANTVAKFVQQQKDKVQNEMSIYAGQLEKVNSLGSKSEEQQVDMLFDLVDSEKTGRVSVKSMSDGIQKCNDNVQTYSDTVQKALDTFGQQGTDGDLQLNRQQFGGVVDNLASELTTSVPVLVEFLILQLASPGRGVGSVNLMDITPIISPSHDAAMASIDGHELVDVLNDPRMMSLFVLFDRDGDNCVAFKEVAIGLYKLTKNVSEAAKDSARLLLMMDKDDKRSLGYEQFGKLVLSLSSALHSTPDEILDDITLALTSHDDISDERAQELLISEEAYSHAKSKDDQKSERSIDALTYARAKKLFELWDANGDGDIDFPELLAGLKRYAKATNGRHSAEKIAVMIMGHDDDRNQTLDPDEFAEAMVDYSEAAQTDLHELIDFMCVVSTLEEDSAYEKAYSHAESVAGRRTSTTSAFQRASMLMTIADVEEGDEDEEEDDW